MTTDDNYITEIATNIRAKIDAGDLPDKGLELLFNSYAVLALAKGGAVTSRDVHDAWSAWATEYDSENPSLIPFDDLTDENKSQDDKFVEAIKTTVSEMNLVPAGKIRISVGAETSESELAAVKEAFETPNIDLAISAGLVRASADGLPMYIAVIAQGLATNALWDLIKFAVQKILSDNRFGRRHQTEIIIRRKKYEAFITKDKFHVKHSEESFQFPDIDSLIAYIEANKLDDE
ncbi:MAG TPA: hypothetical protein VF597_02980 [Candidatus Saccharimonadales bacterium]|jgi:hypothetical protein